MSAKTTTEATEGPVPATDPAQERMGKSIQRVNERRAEKARNGASSDGAPAVEDFNSEGYTDHFTAFLDARRASRIGYWVPCTLGVYKGMSVLFRTGNKSKVRNSRPEYREPIDTRVKRNRLDAVEVEIQTYNAALDVLRRSGVSMPDVVAEELAKFRPYEDMERELEELSDQILQVADPLMLAYHHALCEWQAQYAIDFEPWPFKDVPKPDPDQPKTYHALYHEFEDLHIWLMAEGYPRALEMSAKNY